MFFGNERFESSVFNLIMFSQTLPRVERVHSLEIIDGDDSTATTQKPDISTIADTKQETTDRASKLSYFIGAGFVLLASWAFAFQNFCVKKASAEGFRSFQSLLGRGVIQVLFTGLIDLYDIYCSKATVNNDEQKKKNQSPQNRNDWIYIFLVGFLGFSVAYCNYSGTELLPQGDAASIFATFPIWTVLLAVIFLGEQIRVYHFVAMAFGVSGILLIVKPSFLGLDSSPSTKGARLNHNYGLGVPLVLTAALCNALAYLALRKLKHVKAGYSVYSYGMGCVIGSILMGFTKMKDWKAIDFSTYYQPTILFCLGLCGFLGQYFKTKSIQHVPAGVASLIRSSDVLANYIIQVALFGEKPDALTICGAVCVTLPIIIISLAKLQKQSPDTQSTKPV